MHVDCQRHSHLVPWWGECQTQLPPACPGLWKRPRSAPKAAAAGGTAKSAVLALVTSDSHVGIVVLTSTQPRRPETVPGGAVATVCSEEGAVRHSGAEET